MGLVTSSNVSTKKSLLLRLPVGKVFKI